MKRRLQHPTARGAACAFLLLACASTVGQYGSANLLCTPVKNVLMGGEFQWARRENFSDGFSLNDYRVQFSFKYNFSYKVGG
jgi:hypothetical protein